MNTCMFDSKLLEYKKPFGAVPSGSFVTLRIYLPKNIAPERVSMILRADDRCDKEYPMELLEYTANENIYEVQFLPIEPKLYFYSFLYCTQGNCHTITSDAFQCGEVDTNSHWWQLTVYDHSMKTPQCFGKGIIYQIFPDRFCNSGTEKGPIPYGRSIRRDWGALPVFLPNEKGVFDCSDYFGGDLRGIESKLDYLQSLGVTCLYLNPIFEAHSNHRYNVANYKKIDPLLGTEEDFSSLCAAAKEHNIAVILDGVFNHTGSDSLYFNREGRYGEHVGAYRDSNSPYYPWYHFHEYPDNYDSWWGFETLPAVNETREDYLDFICRSEDSVIHHWMNAGASGFRLDVVDELPDVILDEINKAVKSHGEDCCVIGEVWEDASNKIAYSQRRRYLLGGQLDSVMNYPFRSCVLNYVRYGDSRQFLTTISSIVEHYPLPVLNCAMNPLSTHDTERALTALVGESSEGHDRPWQAQHHYLSMDDYESAIRMLKVAAVIQYFLPGIPSLYYGDEAGLSGYRDPFNRCCYPWGYENPDLVSWFQTLGQLRCSLGFLQHSDFTPLCVTSQICSFVRRMDERNQVFIVVNRTKDGAYFPIPKEFSGIEPLVLCGTYRPGLLSEYGALAFICCED